MISIEDFGKVEIRAGRILEAEEIEGSDKLLKLMVDFGEGAPRQVVSGIKKYFEDQQSLIGITCAFVTNLEPRSIMGFESQAMIMAASTSSGQSTSDDNHFTLLKMDCPPGSKVR